MKQYIVTVKTDAEFDGQIDKIELLDQAQDSRKVYATVYNAWFALLSYVFFGVSNVVMLLVEYRNIKNQYDKYITIFWFLSILVIALINSIASWLAKGGIKNKPSTKIDGFVDEFQKETVFMSPLLGAMMQLVTKLAK